MPPKYFCDYCDKQFHDTPAARKRHTRGAQHQRAKKLWFDSFTAADQEDAKKGVCSYYMRTGTCQYGQQCRYLHPIYPGLIPGGNSPSNANVFGQTMNPASMSPTVVTFRFQAGEVAPSATESKLPPSLQPPPEGGYPQLPMVDWG